MFCTKKGQVTFFILVGLFILFIGLLINHIQQIYEGEVHVFSSPFAGNRTSELVPLTLERCLDGTIVGTCSFQRPLFCSEGKDLVENCRTCGCSQGQYCNGTYCIEVALEKPEKFTVFVLPLNYDPLDLVFLERAGKLIDSLIAETSIKQDQIVIINEPYYTTKTCDISLQNIRIHVASWYASHAKKPLPGMIVDKKGYSVYGYRIFAIDQHEQSVHECGCSFTTYYGDVIYIGGAPCSLPSNIAVHEFGHTVGLCDEYDTCIWEKTNEIYPCRNTKPGLLDSDCGTRCCSNNSLSCCYGKYSQRGFNVMGSSDTPPLRELNFETRFEMSAFLCYHYNICQDES